MAENITLVCPHCFRPLLADDCVGGSRLRCPLCGQKFTVDPSGRCFETSEFVVACPQCSNELTIERSGDGQRHECPFCGQQFILKLPKIAPPRMQSAPLPHPVYAQYTPQQQVQSVPPPQAAADGGSPPPPPAASWKTKLPTMPSLSSDKAKNIANLSILGIVACFTIFCAIQFLWRCFNWKEFSQEGICELCMQKAAKACCWYAERNFGGFPSEKELDGVLRAYIDDRLLASPCFKKYRYLGAGRAYFRNSKNEQPLFVCKTHKKAVYPSGECREYKGEDEK